MGCCRFFSSQYPFVRASLLCSSLLCSSLPVFRCSCLDAAALCRTNVLRPCSLFARCRRFEPLFPTFTVSPAASVHPSFACGLQLSASVILFFGCFRCLSMAVLSFVFSYLYFSVRSCSFVNRVWAGHLADELLVRVLKRCDRFARLLRITL